MSDPDLMLQGLWAETSAPPRDPVFVLEVIERVERRRFWLSLLALTPFTVAVAVAAWALLPVLSDIGGSSVAGMNAGALAGVAAALSMVALIADRRAIEA